MFFTHVPRSRWRTVAGQNQVFLIYDNWDDYGYKTSFDVTFFDNEGTRIDLGLVKIMQREMQGNVQLPDEGFVHLDATYCSLGQEQNYYETLASLGNDRASAILVGLRDCVFNTDIYEEFAEEPAMKASLMRSVSERMILYTFAGALRGQVPLTPFRFTYRMISDEEGSQSPTLEFSVVPHSLPPTNIHAIIGRNGVGKTRMLWDMAAVLCSHESGRGGIRFENELPDPFFGNDAVDAGERFSRLVTVAFSAFDRFQAPKEGSTTEGDLHYSYVGLKKKVGETESPEEEQGGWITKSDEDLLAEFANSLANCVNEPRLQRWKDAVILLEADPGFRDLELLRFENLDQGGRLSRSHELFSKLSSGHKVVLLIVTRLVELVDERTLVLIDEPESHLHPPLLSSLIRVLSMLLTRRNGAAIVATHSPVVLQEAPSSCVWMLRRSGDIVVADRPSVETFGENVGILTREVFGLEVTQSGFHKMVSDIVEEESGRYERVVQRFGGRLGSEARAIALALSRSRE